MSLSPETLFWCWCGLVSADIIPLSGRKHDWRSEACYTTVNCLIIFLAMWITSLS